MRKTKKLVKAKRALCALTAGILATGMVMPVFAQDDDVKNTDRFESASFKGRIISKRLSQISGSDKNHIVDSVQT